MSEQLIKIKVDEPGFSRQVTDFAAVAGMSVGRAFVYQGCLLCGELIKRTPPFSGKAIKRMLEVRQENIALSRAGTSMGPFKPAGISDPDVENMSALQVGKHRVERDVRKVIYGLTGATLSERHMKVSKGGNANMTDWGTLQKCEGKQAVRVFATKGGEVYGADLNEWIPDATLDQLKAHHDTNRGQRGRVTMAGQTTRNIGRWRWLNVLVTVEQTVAKFIKWKQEAVGQGKGGWAEAYMLLGGRMSRNGWIGKHARSAGAMEPREPKVGGKQISIRIINKSRWASGGDPDGIMAASMAGRGKAVAGDIRRRLESLWGSKARRMAA